MKPGQSIRLGARILLALNLLMAFGTLWVFMRMTPAIKVILERNQQSILASEEMLAALAMSVPPGESAATNTNQALINTFKAALKRSQSNVTEGQEPEVLGTVNRHYPKAFAGDMQARSETIQALARLSKINRDAMDIADYRARQLGNAGAWGVVFMAALLFFVGMLFVRSLRKNLIEPLEEIYSVIQAVRNHDPIRRCTSTHESPRDVRVIFTELNELLDQYTAERLHQKLGQ
jgi:hypothetical protein